MIALRDREGDPYETRGSGYRKYLHPPPKKEVIGNSNGGRGVSKAKIYKQKYEAKLELQEGWQQRCGKVGVAGGEGGIKQKTFPRRVIEIGNFLDNKITKKN